MWGFGRYELATVDRDGRAVPAMRTDNLPLAILACEGSKVQGMRPYLFDHETDSFVVMAGNRTN